MIKKGIIVILITISVLIVGCINGNNDDEKLGSQDELDLIIDVENNAYSNSTEYINVTIQLVNTCNETVIVEKRFDLGSNIKINVITPSGDLVIVHVPSSTHLIEKIKLRPNEKKEFQFNLLEKNLVFENKTNYELNEKGNYQIYGEYKSLSGDVLVSEKKSFDYQ